MLRTVVIILILAAVVGYLAYRHNEHDQVTAAQVAEQISDLSSQVQKLQADNRQLRDEVAKVQEENIHLNGYNDELKKALATAQITGKVPLILPYPPK